jgi:hypothetical protein
MRLHIIYLFPWLKKGLGEWLLNEKLLHKQLDVRIKGTVDTLFYNGKYENKCGFVVLDSVPFNTASSVTVRIGLEQSRRSFKLFYLFPQTTTENPGFVPAEAARPVVSTVGQRVVIIGPDVTGNSEYIGSYGMVIECCYNLPPGDALVLMYYPGPNSTFPAYFNESYLCRSHPLY